MENVQLTKWRPVANAVTAVLLPNAGPFHVQVGEAIDVARFFEAHYASLRDEQGLVVRPGLETAVGEGGMHAGLGTEILEIQEATSAAQALYVLATKSDNPMERAEFVLGEIESTLEFIFDDGIEDANDARLKALQDLHASAMSHDAMAAALDDFAAFAEFHRERMGRLGSFNIAHLDEARTLALRLRDQSASKVGAALGDQSAALDLRNRLLTLLQLRVNRVRAAARYVFRHHPDIVRKATSAFQRRRRSDARRAQQRKEAAPVEKPAATPVEA